MNPAEFRANTPYAGFGTTAIDAPVDARRTFIRKTYTHLTAAIYAFVALEFLLFKVGAPEAMMNLLGRSQYSWLIVLGLFVGVSWLAESWARSSTSKAMQYAGLFLYVLAQAIIFVPILAIAQGMVLNVNGMQGIEVIPAAAVTTLIMFGGLTAYAFLSKQDFSFLGSFLNFAAFAAMALIAVSILFGWNLGVWFSAALIVLACGYILYHTSNILHQYSTDQYVAAALALFASVALLFWYVLRLMMAFSNRD